MQSQYQLPKVSTRLGLVWLESRFGSGSFGESLGSAWARFFSENESLGSASKTNSRLGIIYIPTWYTAIFILAQIIL